MRHRSGLIVGMVIGILASAVVGHVLRLAAQQTERPGCSVDHPIDTPRDLSGLSIKNPRVRIVHTTDPGLAGGSMYLQEVDPWLGYAWGRSLFQRSFRAHSSVVAIRPWAFGCGRWPLTKLKPNCCPRR